jgi:hypothetical protein
MAIHGSKFLKKQDAPADGRLTFELRKEILAGAWLRFYGNHVVTGGSGAGTILPAAAQRYLPSIKVSGDGQTVQDWTGEALLDLNAFLLPAPPVQTQPATLAAGTNAAMESMLYLPFSHLHALEPDSAALPGSYIDAPTIEIQTGMASDMARGEDGAMSITTPVIEVTEVPLLEAPNAPIYEINFVRRIAKPITQADDRFQIDLSTLPKGMFLRGLMIRAQDNGSGGKQFSPSDSVIKTFSLFMGGKEKYGKTPWATQRNRNATVYQFSSLKSGVVLIDGAENKHTRVRAPVDPATGRPVPFDPELWRIVAGETSPYLELDVVPGTGETRVEVYALLTAVP